MVFSSHDYYTYYNNLFWRGLMWRKAREGKLKILFCKQILKNLVWFVDTARPIKTTFSEKCESFILVVMYVSKISQN